MNAVRAVVAVIFVSLCCVAVAQTPPVRVRGSIEKFENQVLTVKSRDGSTLNVKLAENSVTAGVARASMADIAAGKFIGTATLGQRDGALVALEVLIFPDAMRGANEGHYPWDLQPQSMMTNATVADVVGGAQERVLTLRCKDGEKKVLVPQGVPIVTFVPADHSALKPGAHIFIGAAQRQPDGSLSAGRVNVGIDGLVPPM